MQDLHRIKILLSPVQQLARLIFTSFRAVCPHHHRNQSTLTVHRGGNQVKARARGVTRFQAIHVHGLIPQQAVAVLLGDAVPGQALFAVHVIELRLAVNDGPGKHGEIVSGAVLARCIQPVYGFEVGIAQVQLFNVVIHHPDELRLTARDVIRQRHAGVIAGINNQAAAEIAHGNPIALLQKHQRRTVKDRIAFCPGVTSDRHNVIGADAVAINSTIDNVPRHQFGQARRITLLMFVARR